MAIMFKGKVVVVMGGAQGTGRCHAECFERDGARVLVIDIKDGGHEMEMI